MYDKKQMIDIYDKNAAVRNDSSISEFKKHEINVFIDLLKIENKQTVLDVGCGTGGIASIFKAGDFKVLGMDFSVNMLNFAKQKQIDTILLDCYDIDKIDEKFDAVFSMNCLLHIPTTDIRDIFVKINGIMKEGGLFYLGLWAGEDFEGIYENDECEKKRFFVFYKQRTLLNLVADFFTIDYYRYIVVHDSVRFHSCVLRKTSGE